jgi:hypothetical protein
MHAAMLVALAGDGPDERLADVIVELDPEAVLELGAKGGGQGLRRRKTETIVKILSGIEARLARDVEQVREEGRRPGIDARAELPARCGAAARSNRCRR